jgi:hypothetical protein
LAVILKTSKPGCSSFDIGYLNFDYLDTALVLDNLYVY